jgi:hypothetical protein
MINSLHSERTESSNILGSDDSDAQECAGSAMDISCPASDPAIYLWRQFSIAHACAQKLTRRQQTIESVLLERVRIRSSVIDLPDDAHGSAAEPEDSGEIQDAALNLVNLAEVEGTTLEARWAAADAQLGYSAALCDEAKALTRVRDLAERLWATPAVSLTGIIAKLDALLSEGPPSYTSPEFPWPQLRAIRLDLEKLRVMRPSPPGR